MSAFTEAVAFNDSMFDRMVALEAHSLPCGLQLEVELLLRWAHS